MKSLPLLLALLLAVPALAQERPDRALAPAGVTILSTEDQARLDAFLAKRPRTVVAARPAGAPRRAPKPPTYDRGAVIFTVDSAYDDDPDTDGDGVCAGPTFGECQLRSALLEAEALGGTQPARIEFDITTGPPGSQVEPGVWRITLVYDGNGDSESDPLPTVFRSDLTIDATTQPGASCGNLVGGVKHDLRVILDGSNLSSGAGLSGYDTQEDYTVRGLVIQNFPYGGIYFFSPGHGMALAECNYIGTDHTGEVAAPNGYGVNVDGSVRNNLVSGNVGTGIFYSDYSQSELDTIIIDNNLIGTDADGDRPLGNGGTGIKVTDTPGVLVTGNVVSANALDGIELERGGFNFGGIVLYDNVVGLSRTGQSLDLGNGANGIRLYNSTTFPWNESGNSIGLPDETPNYVADNAVNGIRVEGVGLDTVRVRNNVVGLDASGNPAPNGLDGISLSQAEGVTVSGNTVAGNAQHGIFLEEDTGTVVEGNTIGLNHLGAPTPNIRDGLRLTGSDAPVIRANTIAGNGAVGVALAEETTLGRTTTGAVIQGNYIGTDAAGAALGNGDDGLWCRNAEGTLVGGSASAGDGNVIAYNGTSSTFQDGVRISTQGSCTDYALLRNRIFGNVGLGIDLGGGGVTPNDQPDADGFTNYPVIESATNDGADAAVTVTLQARPNQQYRIELFRSAAPDPSGHGEGHTFVSNRGVTTDAAGHATTTFSRPAADLSVGTWAAATATVKNGTAFGATSEFSAAAQVVGVGAPLTVTITPTSPAPPVVLQHGDRVFFDVTFDVGPTGPASFEFWTEAVLPGGGVRSPLIGPSTVDVSPPAVVTLSFSQRVPSRAPFGSYTYRVEAGAFPSSVLDSDAFAGEVVPGRSDGPEDWEAFDASGARLDGPQTYDLRTKSGASEGRAAASSTALPTEAALVGAYPNPSRGHATVAFAVPSAQRVTVSAYDVLGRAVARLVDGAVEAGRHEAVLDGAGLPSGVYLVRLTAGHTAQTQRLTLVR